VQVDVHETILRVVLTAEKLPGSLMVPQRTHGRCEPHPGSHCPAAGRPPPFQVASICGGALFWRGSRGSVAFSQQAESSIMPTMTGSRFFAQAMQAYGITHVFFVPTIMLQALAEMEGLDIRRVMTHGEKAPA
jgi:hypothetical protein